MDNLNIFLEVKMTGKCGRPLIGKKSRGKEPVELYFYSPIRLYACTVNTLT